MRNLVRSFLCMMLWTICIINPAPVNAASICDCAIGQAQTNDDIVAHNPMNMIRLSREFYGLTRNFKAQLPDGVELSWNIVGIDSMDVRIEFMIKELEAGVSGFENLSERRKIAFLKKFERTVHWCFRQVKDASSYTVDIQRDRALRRYRRLKSVMTYISEYMPKDVMSLYNKINLRDNVILAYLFPHPESSLVFKSFHVTTITEAELVRFGFSSLDQSSGNGPCECIDARWSNVIIGLNLFYFYQMHWTDLAWERIHLNRDCSRPTYQTFQRNLIFSLTQNHPPRGMYQ